MEQTLASLPDAIQLVSHPTARNAAVAKSKIPAGTNLLSVSALAGILIDTQKGARCDACFRQPSQGSLRRCSGCGSYWYCGSECQTVHWQRVHRRMCKKFNAFTSTTAYQRLPSHAKLETLLLADLLARMSHTTPPFASNDEVSIFLDLIPGQNGGSADLPPFPFQTPPPPEMASNLLSRFGNNNFAIHSHLYTIGHGIFPLASRLFNHSCLPNAAAKYQLSATQLPRMEIVALRDIEQDEEITLPYLDPALLQTRHQILNLSYGFDCQCLSCRFLKKIGYLECKPEPILQELFSSLCTQVKEFAGLHSRTKDNPNSSNPFDSTPKSLHAAFQETFVEQLSEAFSEHSHNGNTDTALEYGTPLLALYTLIYPLNYPQIGTWSNIYFIPRLTSEGIHALEMAKTAWNGFVTSSSDPNQATRHLKADTTLFLTLSKAVLSVYGAEGDTGGPLDELKMLQDLLEEDSA